MFSYRRLLLLDFGFMGVSLLWGIYNAYVPIFLQAGRADYSSTAGMVGFGMGAADTTGLYYLSAQSSAIVGPILSGKIIDIFNNDYRIAFMYGAVTLVIALFFVLPIKRGEALTN